MRATSVFVMCALFTPHMTAAQIRVSPTGVNVASQGATTAFLTFGGIEADQVPADAFWCGELIDARPDVGLRCDPTTLFGQLPIRFDLSRASGTGGFTDIMSIPPSVARRAYQAAAAGQPAAFFYVRRFTSRSGARDVYVAVTCRLTAGGAGSPLALTDVRLAFAAETPVLALAAGDDPPPLGADITYTGTGRLQGRWEVVLPGEDPPSERDLLPEASLPLEQRGTQRRFTSLARFDVFLAPGGRLHLPGPDPTRLPRSVDGVYLLLLRIDATRDVDSESDLSAAGAGIGLVSSGAVAGFSLPTLRYVVGTTSDAPIVVSAKRVGLLQPADGGALLSAHPATFVWEVVPLAARYRLEIERVDGTPVFEAVVGAAVAAYRPPPFLAERAGGAGVSIRWHVVAISAAGREVARSEWRRLTISS
ncbi:MAG: hypothetical protein ABJE10_21585 [bacterium]